MLLKYFYDKRLAQASYMVGCAATGEALVIDPARDITPYLQAAQEEGLKITHIAETHIHADFVSGGRELHAQTGAGLYLSDMGDVNWKYGFVDSHVVLLNDGDSWMVGNIRVDVMHTPGHTPEHISFMITDTAGADRPIGVFTGDFLFVGDVGRPDLLEAAAGFIGTKEIGARQQFATVQKFKTLPDYLQIWPGHGAGSACGKALGAIPSTTLGYEKLLNPAFQIEDESTFVDWLLSDQPEAPRYFAQMKHVNKVGPVLLDDLKTPENLPPAAISQVIEDLVIDMRDAEDFAQAYLPGTLSIPASNKGFINYVGWFVDYKEPFYFIAPDDEAIDEIITTLRSIGIDDVPGYFLPEAINGDTETLNLVTAQEISEKMQAENLTVIDVRGATEYRSQHITGARHIPLGYLTDHLDSIPRDQTVVTQCASGYRSQIAASVLRKHGFTSIVNLSDDISNWSKLLKTEEA